MLSVVIFPLLKFLLCNVISVPCWIVHHFTFHFWLAHWRCLWLTKDFHVCESCLIFCKSGCCEPWFCYVNVFVSFWWSFGSQYLLNTKKIRGFKAGVDSSCVTLLLTEWKMKSCNVALTSESAKLINNYWTRSCKISWFVSGELRQIMICQYLADWSARHWQITIFCDNRIQ